MATIMTRFGAAVAVLGLAALAAQAFAQQGGMMSQEMADLSTLAPERQVASLRYCDAVYRITTGEGDTLEFPEFNLRFKTDASDLGPPPGTPALLPAAMMGDRAFVIFADPAEISSFIGTEC